VQKVAVKKIRPQSVAKPVREDILILSPETSIRSSV
jgi:hypothetical protein